MRLLCRATLLLLVAVPLSGCGIYRSSAAIRKADDAYAAASAVNARARAPYQFTLGEEYLRKAHEEAGYSDYQTAERLAKRSEGFLNNAELAAKTDDRSTDGGDE